MAAKKASSRSKSRSKASGSSRGAKKAARKGGMKMSGSAKARSGAKSRSGTSRSASSAGKRKPARKKAVRTMSMRGKSVKKTAKTIGVKVLAGAVSGAVKAIIPPLEQAATTSERVAGITPQAPEERLGTRPESDFH